MDESGWDMFSGNAIEEQAPTLSTMVSVIYRGALDLELEEAITNALNNQVKGKKFTLKECYYLDSGN